MISEINENHDVLNALEIPVMDKGSVPEWVMIARAGRWRGHPAGPEVVTPEHLACALAQFDRHYAANGADLVIDYHHASAAVPVLTDRAPAAGWIKSMELRTGALNVAQPFDSAQGPPSGPSDRRPAGPPPDELWARVMWTAEAARSIAAREFRYLSPALIFGAPDRVSGEPAAMQIASVALTNTPFLTELKALNSSGVTPCEGSFALRRGGLQGMLSANQALRRSTEPSQGEEGAQPRACGMPLQDIAALLGVAPEEPCVTKALNELVLERRMAKAEAVVNDAVTGGRITPAQRQFFLNCALSDAEGTRACLNSLTPIVAQAALRRPATPGVRELTEPERHVCRLLRLDGKTFLSAERDTND